MSLPLSSWAIKQPLTSFVVFFGLFVAGFLAYLNLPINNWPDVEIPIVNVAINLPNANPKEIESYITRPLEASLASIGNVKHITSTLTEGVSSTQIEFTSGSEISQVMSKVRDKVDLLKPLLPTQAEPPIIQAIEADFSPILTFAVSNPNQSIAETAWFIDHQVFNQLLKIKGIAKLQRQGGQDREIHIALDPARLRAYGLTAAEVNTRIQQSIQTLSSGRIDDQMQEIPIKVIGAKSSLDLLTNLKIPHGSGNYVRIAEIGDITDTVNEQRQLAILNQHPVVGFAVYRARSASEVNIEKAVNEAVVKLKQKYPEMRFTPIQSQVTFTKQNYHAALWAFVEGTLFAAIMVFLFLRDWRATMIASLAIPFSVVPTFIVLQWLGFSLNIVTLLALSLVSGILVDDAIVELENIIRHLRLGKTPYQAAMDAADEIGLAVVATSLVIIAVFVPVSFMDGVVGKYFSQFGLTIAVATFFSLVVARFITPVMAAYFINPVTESTGQPRWVSQYLNVLKKALNNRIEMLVFAVVILLSTLIIGLCLPSEFMTQEDKSESTLQVTLPPGTRLSDTQFAVSALIDQLLKQPEVKSIYALIGGDDAETNVQGVVRQATLTVTLEPPSERKDTIHAFEQRMLTVLAEVPDVSLSFLSENGTQALTIGLNSDDPVLLQQTTAEVAKQMRGLSQLVNVSTNLPLPRTELIITPRNQDAARMGVDVTSISDTIRIAMMGDMKANLAKLTIDQRDIPIRVLLNNKVKDQRLVLNQLLVPTKNGALVPLSAVADIKLGAGMTSISRYDQRQQMLLETDLNDVTLGEALTLIEELPAMQHLPSGVTKVDTGDAELLTEMFASFSAAMFAGILMVFMVLVLLFRNLLQPATIMFSLPLSICGALLALSFTGYALSLPAIIGILMLMGIVAKNGILLVDCMIENRSAGLDLESSIMRACEQRARPIVMTSLAMIAGMLPIILGFGAGAAFRTPMALAVVGGLISSTLLSLLFIPILYLMINDLEAWLSLKTARLIEF